MIGVAGLRSTFNQFLQHPADPCHSLRVLQVWTFNDRVAFVLSVTENGQPVQDGIKLQRLRQLLLRMMDEQGTGIVSIKKVGQLHLLGTSFSRARWGMTCKLRGFQVKVASTVKMTCCPNLAGGLLAQVSSASIR